MSATTTRRSFISGQSKPIAGETWFYDGNAERREACVHLHGEIQVDRVDEFSMEVYGPDGQTYTISEAEWETARVADYLEG